MSEKKEKKLHIRENIVIILLLVIVAWFAGVMILNQVHGSMVKTAEVQQMVLENVSVGYGQVSGQENGVYATADGPIERLIQEGERVRKGNAVFRVYENYAYTNYAGRVSYQLDGLEEVTDLNGVCCTDLETRYREQQNGAQQEEATEAVSGEMYAKVINTFDDIYVYVTVETNEHTAALESEQRFPVRLVDLDYEMNGKLTEVLDTADGHRYLKIKLSDVKEMVFQQRLYKVELPFDRVRALAVPSTAIMEKKGETGVYCLRKGFAFWTPVTPGAVREESGMTIIEEGLEPGDMVVTTPNYVREGENIKF